MPVAFRRNSSPCTAINDARTSTHFPANFPSEECIFLRSTSMPTYYLAIHNTPRLHRATVLISRHQSVMLSSAIRQGQVTLWIFAQRLQNRNKSIFWLAFGQISVEKSLIKSLVWLSRDTSIIISFMWARMPVDVTCTPRSIRRAVPISAKQCSEWAKKSIISRECCYRWF